MNRYLVIVLKEFQWCAFDASMPLINSVSQIQWLQRCGHTCNESLLTLVSCHTESHVTSLVACKIYKVGSHSPRSQPREKRREREEKRRKKKKKNPFPNKTISYCCPRTAIVTGYRKGETENERFQRSQLPRAVSYCRSSSVATANWYLSRQSTRFAGASLTMQTCTWQRQFLKRQKRKAVFQRPKTKNQNQNKTKKSAATKALLVFCSDNRC